MIVIKEWISFKGMQRDTKVYQSDWYLSFDN